MIVCNNCKLVVDENTIYCPRCGRRLVNGPQPVRMNRGTDPIVRSLLIEARTFKSRSAWAEAVEKCMEALKREPENPETFTVLGEIYEAQGRVDQAIQWYQMAEMEYSSSGERVPSLQEKIRSLESRRAATHNTTGWFDRYVAGRRFSSSVRVITFALVGFLILLILGAVFVIVSDRMRTELIENSQSQIRYQMSANGETVSFTAEDAEIAEGNLTGMDRINRITL